MNTKAKTIVFWAVLIGVAVLLWAVVQNKPTPPKATYSQFLQQVQAGRVTNAVIVASNRGPNPVDYNLKDGARMHTVLPHNDRDALEAMQQKLVDIEIQDGSSRWTQVLWNATPFLLLVAFWLFMMGQMSKRRHAK